MSPTSCTPRTTASIRGSRWIAETRPAQRHARAVDLDLDAADIESRSAERARHRIVQHALIRGQDPLTFERGAFLIDRRAVATIGLRHGVARDVVINCEVDVRA